MKGVNKVILLGNLGGDPDIRYSATGSAVATVSIATSESWKDKDGGQQDRTEWHRVVFFSRLAEIVGEYLKKGAKVYVEGRLQTRKWKDKDGQERYTTEIVANEMQMLGGDAAKHTGKAQSDAFAADAHAQGELYNAHMCDYAGVKGGDKKMQDIPF